MDKYYEITFTALAVILFIAAIAVINGSQDQKIMAQAARIEQLQGDVKAMTSAFEDIELELIRVQAAYASWSKEIEKLRSAKDAVPEIPEIGRWKNRKEATK